MTSVTFSDDSDTFCDVTVENVVKPTAGVVGLNVTLTVNSISAASVVSGNVVVDTVDVVVNFVVDGEEVVVGAVISVSTVVSVVSASVVLSVVIVVGSVVVVVVEVVDVDSGLGGTVDISTQPSGGVMGDHVSERGSKIICKKRHILKLRLKTLFNKEKVDHETLQSPT